MTLPESDFTWRRIFSYTSFCALLALIAWTTPRIDDPAKLSNIIFWLIVLLWWIVTYYMVAPSAEQIARIIQAARLQLFGRDREE